MSDIPSIALDEETQRRYLNYALSVITSRALPDVRDGLKPVQRRILFDMFHDLRLTSDAKYRKCAAVVGDVLGKYHPHGDTSVYDALVRMAQSFSLRAPLVEGQGNFGSLDGDSAAAMRYTECRLAPIADELLSEIRQKTVEWRPNYDGTRSEPIVVPARFPNLLVNGASGIAVGMATSIPPHNLGEVITAAIALIDDPTLETKDLLKSIKGPDFPTGGQIVTPRAELRAIYEAGHGSIRLRGEWKTESDTKGRVTTEYVIITSIPYGPTKAAIIEQIGAIVEEKKLPLIVDVRDESTDDVRIVLELKKGADAEMAMAFLCRHTQLQINVQVNLTCLVPTANPEVGAPERLNLAQMLRHFLDFRLTVVTRRITHELGELQQRIHLLEGFEKIYDAVDETIKIIRRSEGKADAAAKLMKRFELDEEQVDAILELKLYRLARLEIVVIQKELDEKRRAARKLEALLKSPGKLWAVVKDELAEVHVKYADKRRSRLGVVEEVEFDPTKYIVQEDANVALTRDGWVKRVKEIKDISSTRTREGDEVAQVVGGSTSECVVFFTNYGSAYVCRINDIPPSSGYGDPIQKLFKFDDQERVVFALSLDPRVKPKEENLLAIMKSGRGMRFPLASHSEVSTRAGRKFASVTDGDEVVGVRPVRDESIVVVAAASSHVLILRAGEVNLLAGPGKGFTVIKIDDDDRVLGFSVDSAITVENGKGDALTFEPSVRSLGERGQRGRCEAKRAGFAKVIPPPPTLPQLAPPPALSSGPQSGDLL